MHRIFFETIILEFSVVYPDTRTTYYYELCSWCMSRNMPYDTLDCVVDIRTVVLVTYIQVSTIIVLDQSVTSKRLWRIVAEPHLYGRLNLNSTRP